MYFLKGNKSSVVDSHKFCQMEVEVQESILSLSESRQKMSHKCVFFNQKGTIGSVCSHILLHIYIKRYVLSARI